MRIGVSLQDPSGPSPMTALREELQRAADHGFASAWMSNIFGVDALTALAVAGSQVHRQGVAGQSVTPAVLSLVHELSGGRSVAVNRLLIADNAGLAAEVAAAHAREASSPG